ncbi:hypothetical protein FOMG_16422 [Fusarium oxysporum f. sp. melonis 26406]|uniref:Uncharacterized protein n=2 Tax=Fusarium oxysporum f. sp. melonis 26406 TaxID=1089452 RepID=W9ZFB1_FUSOX|nr:hypothetical protein FOMG_16422 [Fusarium oxysporum f. sp. melonis 26406]
MKHVQRFKARILGRSESPPKPTLENSCPRLDESSSSVTESTKSRTTTHGLFILADSKPDEAGLMDFPVDIVAIHGLNGNAISTWRHEPDGTVWLRDLLPNFLPGCRVYTYGYPSKIWSQSSERVQEYALNLLVSLRDVREDLNASKRSIIFVCHSLGGIVFKQALVAAHENDDLYGDVLKSVRGVVFLATPHRGSNAANLASICGSIVNSFASAGLGPKTVRTDLLKTLIYDSDTLQDLTMSARNRLGNIHVVSFYETLPLPMGPLSSSLVVSPASAMLGIPYEEVIPMPEDHRTICRFPGETESYLKVARALRRIATKSSNVGPTIKRTSTHSSNIVLSGLERTCMLLLSDNDVAKDVEPPPKPVPGTCQWIRGHSLFVSWLEKGTNALLWLTGHPGCGKTMLSYSLAQYFDDACNKSRNVLIYLCQNKNKQTDARAVLIGLILQIIHRHRSLVRYIRSAFEKQGSSIIQSFASLWRIFLRITMDPKSGPLYVILDALDECEKTSCHQLLVSISDMLTDSSQSMKGGSRVKFLITSRPFLHQSYANSQKVFQSQISIDDDQTGYTEDLQTFIQERIHEISLNRQFSNDIRDFLCEAIMSKADRTFLWIHMVLASIEESLLTSRKEFQKIITSIPEGLAEIYHRYLTAIPLDHQEDASKLLKLLLACSRPLSLDELNIAFTMDPSYTTAESIMQNSHNSIAHTVQGILGSLVRVTGQQVSLVHQSVKDYLQDQYIASIDSPPAIRMVNPQGSALQLATVCIQYLLLDDFTVDFFPTNDSPTSVIAEETDVFGELPLGDFEGDFWDQEDHDLGSNTLFHDPAILHPEICDSLVSDYPFYTYASLHWAEHFARCEEDAPEELKDFARSLLNPDTANCRNWLSFYHVKAPTPLDDDLMDQNPIILASQFDSYTVLKSLLLDCEPSQVIKNQSLYWASRLGHDRIVTALLQSGAEPNTRQLEGQTALTVASEHGNRSCVTALLADSRINVNAPGRNGRTALSFACGGGHDDIVKELLNQKACNPDEPDNAGATPFFWAVGGGHHSILSTLARLRSVDINHRDKTGRTAVSWASGDGMADTLIRLLKLPRININAKDNKGRSPLSWAAGNGCTDVVEILLASPKIDKTSIDNDNRNAISWASARGHCQVLVRLLEAGCPGVDAEDIDGWTPLAWAIQTDSPDTVQALISDENVLIERRDRGGRTALSWAVEYGHIEVVKVLLRAGADTGTQTRSGRTPAMIAKDFGRDDIVKELEVYGP